MTGALLMWMLACGGTVEASSEPAAIAAIANEIAANPADSEAILEKSGHTKASFDDALYEIAMDPDKSKAYLEAR